MYSGFSLETVSGRLPGTLWYLSGRMGKQVEDMKLGGEKVCTSSKRGKEKEKHALCSSKIISHFLVWHEG